MQEYNLNVTQWCILDIISTASAWCEIITYKETHYYWISKNKICNELKALDLKADTIYRNLKSLCELGFIKYEKEHKKDLVILTELGKSLFFKDENSEINPNHYAGNKSENNSEINPTYNNTNINTSSIDYEAFLNLWNEFATKTNKPKIAKLTDSRKKKLALRLKEYKNLL
jgi:DNA-binding PadR family transcriptional regulator